jgi:catechol 2,3-dioxygenase-like lactoylglutathione lyase family enzyme
MDLGWFETGLPTKDIQTTLAFYEGLGFERVEGQVETGTFTLLRGDCRLGLYQGHLHPDQLQLIFWQGDVDAIAALATAKGLTFESELKKAEDGGGAFMLKDPDGHPLFFIYMPVFYVHLPDYAQEAPPREPTQPLEPDMALGWFELSLDVKDIERSVAFYEALGFQQVGGKIEDRHVTLQNRDCRLCLYQGHLDPAEAQLIFWQGDVKAATEGLAERGAAFEARFKDGPITTDEGHVAAMLRDPDGQLIYLVNIPGVTRRPWVERVSPPAAHSREGGNPGGQPDTSDRSPGSPPSRG